MMAPFYIYTYGYNPEEGALAEMEIRAFFGQSTVGKVIGSSVSIDPSRSVFIREKLHVLKSAVSVDEILLDVYN